jgi:hypothetical protein
MPVEFATPLRYRFASLGICLRRALFLQAYAVTVKEFQALLEGRDPYPWQPHEDRWTLSCSHQPVVGQPAKTSGSPAFPGTYVKWREELNALLDKAGVKMTPTGSGTSGSASGWLRALRRPTLARWSALARRQSEKRPSTGSRTQKIVWMRFSANHGLSRVLTRTAMRRNS